MTTATVPIQITCPDWCTVSKDQHLGELEDWEGRVVHMGDVWIGHGNDYVLAGLTTWPDGTPEERPLSKLHLHCDLSSDMQPAVVEEMAVAVIGFMESERQAGRA